MDNHELAQHTGMVYTIAGQFKRKIPRHIEYDELVGEGMLALVRCGRRYDPSRGKFSTLAYPRIRGAMLDYLRVTQPGGRKMKRELFVMSMQDGVNGNRPRDSYNVTAVEDILTTPPAYELYRVERERLDDLLAQLPARVQSMMRARCAGQRLHEIGETWGLTESRISQIVQATREQLRVLAAQQPERYADWYAVYHAEMNRGY